MKKFYFLMAALFCATALLSGCSDDDDKEEGGGGNGQGAGNGGSGVTVLSKKITKIVQSADNYTYTYLYAYDAEGRLSKVTETYNNESDYSDVTDISYSDNQITLTIGEDQTIIKLENNKAVSLTEDDNAHNYRFEVAYHYTGNYLSKMTTKDLQKTSEGWEEEDNTETTFTVKEGNLTKITNKDSEETYTTSLTMSSYDNNTNIDLYGVIMGEETYLLCVAGTRYKKLPAKVVAQGESGEYAGTTTYTYEADQNGYITKITESVTEEGRNRTIVYTITYE